VIRRVLVICLFGSLLTVGAAPAGANGHHGGPHRGGFLFIGTDQEEFDGAPNGPDRLGRFQTAGPNVGAGTIIATTFPINGMTDAHGFLYSGDPSSNTIRRISYNGSLLGSTVGGFQAGCCSEDMVLAGRSLYHAHYPSKIEKLNPRTGALLQTYLQSDVVGMTLVTKDEDDDDDGGDHGHSQRFHSTASTSWYHHDDNEREIWITHWNAHQVGTWDPATNTFTAHFTTPNRAGGLAWDQRNHVLWVGMQGGLVVPYHLNGTPYNAGFHPFGTISDTIDGLEFVKKIHHHHDHD
jgi:hypothetical protein